MQANTLRPEPPKRPRRQPMSMRAALEWAFGAQAAQLDLGDGMAASGYGYISSTASILQHEALGCRIDGGGRSAKHADAGMIAALLATMPERLGGKWMAARIARLAQAGAEPDAMLGAVVRCQPADWVINRHGRRARRSPIEGQFYETVVRGVLRRVPVEHCAVTFSPTPQQIDEARAAWAAWRQGLHWLRGALIEEGALTTIALTSELPEMWR